MKKLLAWVLLLTLVVGMLAGCGNKQTEDPTQPTVVQGDVEGINAALSYLKAMYPNAEEAIPTPRDFSRMNLVRVAGIPYAVVWTTSLGEEYLTVVDNGDGTATIQVIKNPEEDMPYTLTATISDDAGNSVSHSWDMVLPKAVDMGAVVDEAYLLANGESLPYEVTLTGKLISIDTVYSDEYKNITVTMAVEGKEDKPIKCYRLKGEGVADLAVGNIITVTGTIKNYNGTIEFDSGCILEAVEKGDAVEAPTDLGEILKAAYALKSGASLPYPVTMTGKVTKIDAPYDANYGNISVVIVADGYAKYPILCYRLKGLGADQIAIGDTITVTGIIKNYNGTIEFDAGCQMTDRVSGGGVAQQESFDEAKILADAKKLKSGQKLAYYANLTGKVTKIDTPYDKEYGNISVYINVNGTTLLCYRLKSGGAEVSKIAAGDTVTVRGIIENYKGALQFGSGSTLTDRESGGGVAKPESSNQAQILGDAAKLASGAKLDYYATLTGKVTAIDTPYDKEYGNISVYIDVDGTSLLCYRLKSGAANASKVAVGDTITVRGVIENYKGALQFGTGSTLQKRVSGGGTVKPESSDAATILADAAALAQGQKLDYYATLTGKVTKIDAPYDKGYGNISVYIDVNGTELLCYRLKSGAANVSKIASGDTITVRGVIENYKGSLQFGNGSTLQKRVSGGGVAKPESSNAAEILADAANLATGESLEYYANLTGVVTSIKTPYDGNYGNVTLYIDVDGTNLYCYRMKSGAADASKVKVGDTITVRGVIENYKGEIQFGTGCTVEKLIPGSDEPETPTTEPTVSGDAVATVVIYNPSSGKALSSNPSREGSYYLGGVDVTVNGTTVTGFGATEQWGLIDNGDGTYSFSYNGKNLAMGTEFSSTPLGDVNDDWKVIDAGNGLYYIENTVRTNNRLQWRAETYNYFSCYYQNNTGDAYKFAFYVVSGTLPNFGEVTEPEVTEPESTEPGASEPSGDAVVVIYNPSSGKALSSNPSRDGSYYLGGVDVTVNGTTVTGFGATEQWKLINNGDGTYSFSYNGKNLAMGTQYSSTPLGDVNDDWKVIDAGNGLYYIENTVRTNNRLQWRAETYNYFSCYHSNNTGDAYKFAFYVISGSLPFGGTTEPEVTEPVTTEPTTTEPETTQPSGDTVVVIYNPSSGKALSSNPSRDGSYYLGGVDVTVNGTTVTGFGATEQWTLINNGDGTYSFSYNGKKLAMGTQYSSTPLGEVNDDWKVIDAGNGLYYIENTVRTDNRLQWRAETYNYFSCYYKDNTGDAYKFAFYVISGSLPFGGTTEPEVTEPEVTEPETTEPETTEPETTQPSGDTVVVIYNPSSGKALSSNPSRDGSYYLGGVDVTVNGTTVTGFGATEQWKLINNGDGTYSFSYNGKNLAMGTQYSSTPLGDVNDDWKVIDAGNGLYYIENTVRTNNRLQWRAETYNYFSCYHSNNTGDAYKFAFYVISGSLPFGGTTEPEVTEPVTTEPTTTEPETTEPGVAGEAYYKITSAAEFTSGKYVMVVSTGYAPGVVDGTWLSAVQPVIEGNLVTDTKGGVWTLTVNGSTVTIADSNGTLIGPKGGNNNGLATGKAYSWNWAFENGTFTFAGTGSDTVVLASNTTTGTNGGFNRFRGYKTTTVSGNPSSYPSAFTLYKLGEGVIDPDVTEPEVTQPEVTEPETTVPSVPGTDPSIVVEPVLNTAYKLGMNIKGKIMYFNGNVGNKSYRLAISENIADAVDVYLEAVEGQQGARLYFMNGTTKTYIRVSEYTKDDGNLGGTLELTTNVPAEVFGWMAEANTLLYTNGSNSYYMGTYDYNGTIYENISVSSTYFITGDKASNLEVTQFPVHFYAADSTVEPEVTEPETTEPTTTEPETTQPSGDTVVVIYNPSSGKALSSNPSRDGSYYLGGVDVTVNGTTVTGFGATEQWKLINNGDGTYSFSYNGKNLAMGTQYSSTPLGDVNDDWKVIDAGNGLYYIENTVRTNNRLQWRAETYNYFSCYHSNNTGDAYKFAFYVISGSLPFGGTTEPEVTEPVTTEPTTTEPETTQPSGDTVVVIYNPSSGKALSSNPSRDGSYYLGGVDVTVNGTTVTGFGATEQWTLINNGDGTYSFSYNGKKLAMGTQYSSTPLGEVNDDWKVIDAGNGLYYIENTVRTDNRLQWRAETYNYFSCYYKDNTGDAYKFAFYVISGSLPFGGTTEPEVTEPETTEPETTEPETTEPETTEPETTEPETTQPENPVVGGSADFASITTTNANGDSSYTKTFTTANGWTVEYSAIQTGGPAGCSNPQFAVIGPNNTYKAVCLNGKTSAPGKLTSPTLTTGISKLTIQYTKMFTDTNLSVTVTVKDAAGNVYTHVVEKLAIDKNEKYVVYTDVWTLDTPVAGEFTIEVVNNCPSALNSNKDRFTILDLSWEGAAAAHTHEYTATTTATCTAAGVTTYTCDCGDSYTEEVEKLGHIDENLDVECDREGCTSKVAPPADSVLSTYTANCLGSKLSVSNKYYVEGTIAEVLDAKNGIFLIDDGTGEKFYFRLPKDADGVSHANWAIKLVVGDKVKVYGAINKYTTSSAPNGQYWPAMQGPVVTIIEQHPHDFTAIPATCSEPAFCACGQSYGEPLGCADTNGDDLCDDCGRNVKYIYEYVEIRTDNNSGVIDTTAGTYTWGNSNFDVQVVKGTGSQLYSTAKDHMRVYKGNQFVLANKNGIAVKTITVYLTNATQVTNFEKFLTGYTYTKDAENFTVTIEINSAETLTFNNTGSTTQIKGVEFGYEKPNA